MKRLSVAGFLSGALLGGALVVANAAGAVPYPDALAAAGWHTITMATLANDLQANVKPPERTFAITIDDGWDDGYTYALPILAQHGFGHAGRRDAGRTRRAAAARRKGRRDRQPDRQDFRRRQVAPTAVVTARILR